MQRGSFSAAVTVLERLLDHCPSDCLAYLQLSLVLLAVEGVSAVAVANVSLLLKWAHQLQPQNLHLNRMIDLVLRIIA